VTGGAFLAVLFTIGLTLPLDVSHDPARVAPVVGLMMFVGYMAMASMPAILGAVRDATGSFTTSLWLIVAGMVAMVGASLLASPERLAGRA
jgi:CP family cyanate transporter-like MFS transporter